MKTSSFPPLEFLLRFLSLSFLWITRIHFIYFQLFSRGYYTYHFNTTVLSPSNSAIWVARVCTWLLWPGAANCLSGISAPVTRSAYLEVMEIFTGRDQESDRCGKHLTGILETQPSLIFLKFLFAVTGFSVAVHSPNTCGCNLVVEAFIHEVTKGRGN